MLWCPRLVQFCVCLSFEMPVGGNLDNGNEYKLFAVLLVIIQTGQRSSSQPPLLRSFFSSLTILQLDSAGIMDPTCYAANPFNKELGQFVVSLLVCGTCAVLLTALECTTRHRLVAQVARGSRSQRILLRLSKLLAVPCRVSLSVLTILYPTIATSALRMLYCTRQSHGGARVLYANPVYECYTGYHLTAGALAWITLAVHVAGFPIVSWLYLRRRVEDHVLSRASKVRHHTPEQSQVPSNRLACVGCLIG